MRSSIIAAAAFALGAVATPTLVKKDCNDTCMTYDQAAQVANNFQTLIADYSDALAEESLTADFQDYSDSVTTLIDSGCASGPQALGSITFDGRAAFEAGQSSQPAIPFEILNMWYACTGPVVIRWRSAQSPEEITGNIVMETERGNGTQPWLISTVYSEFNSGAWLVNLGVFTPNCSANGTSLSGPVGKRSLAALPARIM